MGGGGLYFEEKKFRRCTVFIFSQQYLKIDYTFIIHENEHIKVYISMIAQKLFDGVWLSFLICIRLNFSEKVPEDFKIVGLSLPSKK